MREVYKRTLNRGNSNSYEFTNNGKELRIECSLDGYYDDWTDDRTIHLYFRVLENKNGYWYQEEKSLGDMDRFTRNNYPEEVKIVKRQIANHILTL